MKKILIIPSWYPTDFAPLKGHYFKEQACLLNQETDFEIKVLFGQKQSTAFLKWLWVYVKSIFSKGTEISKDWVLQTPEAFGFYIPANRRIPERFQLALEIKLYQLAYRSFLDQHWVPDLIHAQSGMDAGIFAYEMSKSSSIPFVIIEHQVFVFHYYSKLRAKLVLEAFKAAIKTAAVSFDERKQVLMNQTECNPVVIWNLVDETKYKIKLERRDKQFTIITILNSLPIKGAENFLWAIFELSQSTKDFKFIMIGKGADENSNDPPANLFIKKSKELGVYEFGDFIPFVERDQISDILNKAHIFVSPTIQEPHGIAVREAMMCGLPIVTTANGGVEDSITPETGLIVPVKNPVVLAEAILKIKDNLHNYDPQKIRELAIQQCGREAFLKAMTGFYQID